MLQEQVLEQPLAVPLLAPVVSQPQVQTAKAQAAAKRKTRFDTVQAGRGLAALIVVLFHVNTCVFGDPDFFPKRFFPRFTSGRGRVEYFFVISGFLITYLHWDDLRISGRVLQFLRKRLFRIYPLYWLVLSAFLAYKLFTHHYTSIDGSYLTPLLSDISLFPTKYFPTLPVVWTLKHEMLFYGFFALIVWRRAVGLGLAAVAALGSLLIIPLMFISPQSVLEPQRLSQPEFWLLSQTLAMQFFNPLHLLFFYGAAVVWLLKRGKVPRPGLLAALGGIVFLASGVYDCYAQDGGALQIVRSQIFGLAAAVALAGLLELERGNAFVPPKLLCRAGDASYSIYLIHFPVLILAAKLVLVIHRSHPLPQWGIFYGIFLVAVAAGLLVHIFVEKPLSKAIR